MTAFLNVFAMLFATMGPIEALFVFAEKTKSLEGKVRRRIALRAVLVATVIGLLFVVFGQFLMDLFHFSVGALTVAGGLILLLFGLRMVLAEGHEEHTIADSDASSLAVYPLAVPLLASPMGIAVLTMISASDKATSKTFIGLVIALLLVMAINVLVLLLADKLMRFITTGLLQVANRLLGVLLTALAVQSLAGGLAQLGIVTLTGGH